MIGSDGNDASGGVPGSSDALLGFGAGLVRRIERILVRFDWAVAFCGWLVSGGGMRDGLTDGGDVLCHAA